jgi:hypothetical protein
MVEILNTGTDTLFLNKGAVDLKYEDGTIADKVRYITPYPQIIAPGERAYYYAQSILEGVPADAQLQVIPLPDIVRSENNIVRYQTAGVKVFDTSIWGLRASGKVEYSGEAELLINVAVVVFDLEGKPIAVLSDYVLADASKNNKFEMSQWIIADYLKSKIISRFEAFAYPTLYQY